MIFSLENASNAPQSTMDNTGKMNKTRSVENLLELGDKDKPGGFSPAADSKEKPGRQNPVSNKRSGSGI